jgi:hypothetical protein
LRNAGFKNPRIAWDNSFEDLPQIEKQVQMLKDAGFSAKDIYIFVLYNWEYDYDVLERKRAECYRLGVQISDCRFRPLTATSDNFSSRMIQSDVDYFINSPKWSDYSVKRFRSSVRKHNICVRHNIPFHSSILERKLIDRDEYGKMKKASKEEILRTLPDAWFPQDFHSL